MDRWVPGYKYGFSVRPDPIRLVVTGLCLVGVPIRFAIKVRTLVPDALHKWGTEVGTDNTPFKMSSVTIEVLTT
jgi:hypothetical protein